MGLGEPRKPGSMVDINVATAPAGPPQQLSLVMLFKLFG